MNESIIRSVGAPLSAPRFGLAAHPPAGWRVEVARRPVVEPGSRTYPVLHAATVDLPATRGDFGTGVVDILGPQDAFVALIEYGDNVADQGLFAKQGMPAIAPSQFSPNRLQRQLPGRSAAQHFFSEGGRAFCLFAVVGEHSRRMATVPHVARMTSTLRITSASTLHRMGVQR